MLCFSELWLSEKVTDGMLDPASHFNIYRFDRIDGYGGVCIFISKDIPSRANINYNNIIPGVEFIGCNLTINKLQVDFYCYIVNQTSRQI